LTDTNAYSWTPPHTGFVPAVIGLAAQYGSSSGAQVAFIGNNTTSGIALFNSISAALTADGVKNVTDVILPTGATEPQAVSAVQASGAGGASIFIVLQSDTGCINVFDALTSLGYSPAHVIAPFTCLDPTVVSHYGGMLPKNFDIIDFGDSPYVPGLATGVNSYLAAMKQYAPATDPTGPSHLLWDALMTVDKLANKIGISKVTSATMKNALMNFTGPAWGVPGPIQCGAYTTAPSACSSQYEIINYTGTAYTQTPFTVAH
jgi:hypothetical protein